MTEFVRTIKIGQAMVSIINIGDIYLPLADHLNVARSEIHHHGDLHGLAEQTVIPLQYFLIRLPHTTVLVDAGIYDVETEPEYAIIGYRPPAGLIEQLATLGVPLDNVQHVVITHAHWDHFNGATVEQDGKYVPQFPKATYYLGQADWESAATAMQNPTSIEARTFKVLHEATQLELVVGDREIAEGVQIIAAAGETRGHQIVRLESDGKTLYCMGDLYHHLAEIAHPDWKVNWAKAEPLFASRNQLVNRALDEQAFLVGSHLPGIGQLYATESGVAWEAEPSLD